MKSDLGTPDISLAMPSMPPAIIRQFLGQSAELIDRLDTDLASLRRWPQDTLAADRIAGALAALRTGAGFLDLSEFENAAARATETLRELRQSSGLHDADAVAALGRAIETLKASKSDIERTVGGEAISVPKQPAADVEPTNTKRSATGHGPLVERRPLRLDDAKSALVEYMVEDLRDAIALAEQAIRRAESRAGRASGASELVRIGSEMSRTATFFELPGLHALADGLASTGAAIPAMSDAGLGQTFPRLHGIIELLRELADGLAYSTIIVRPVDGLCDALRAIADGRELESSDVLPAGCPAIMALEADGVVARVDQAPQEDSETVMASITEPTMGEDHIDAVTETNAASVVTVPVPAAVIPTTPIPCVPQDDVPLVDASASASAERIEHEIAAACLASEAAPNRKDHVVSELGNLIAQANRLAALPQDVSAMVEPPRLITRVSHIASDVARATSDLKAAVLDARALPIGTLLRACADAAESHATNGGVTINVELHGESIEIDSGVIERLREPMVRLLAMFGAAVAPRAESPNLTCGASIDESADVVEIRVGCSTRAGVMDVKCADVESLRQTVEAIHGVFVCNADASGHVELTIRVPTNLAFLYCTVIRIGTTLAAIPMSGIDEIVKPEPDQIVGTGGSRVVLIRDGAAALLDGYELFGETNEPRGTTPYAVVVSHGGRRVAIACQRALGAQEVVVRPIAPVPRRLGPVSGVGAASDGAATLIIDVPGLVRMVEGRSASAGGSGELGIAA